MVVGADNAPEAVLGANQTPGAAPGGGTSGRHGGVGLGNKNTTNAVAKGEMRSRFVGNTTKMKGHVFQPRNASKNANQYHDTVEVLRQYVVKEYETGRELMALFLATPTQPVITEPPDDPTPTGRADDGTPKLTTRDNKIFDLLIKRYLEREDQLKDNLHSLFYIILGNATKQ